MSPESLRSLSRVHGVAAWAATASLVAAAWLFARASSADSARPATSTARRVVSGVAVAVLLAAAGLGLALHDPYRARLRQRLFLSSPALGWLFERKQHLAFAAVLLAVCALATATRLDRDLGAPGARDLRRTAALAWIASAALALGASIASAVVAGRAHF